MRELDENGRPIDDQPRWAIPSGLVVGHTGITITPDAGSIGDVNSNNVGSGARFNGGKTRYDLIPTHLLRSTADVLEYGAKKYAPWNWAKGMSYEAIIGCLKRHLAAIEIGEDVDPETQKRHVGHMMCNLLFLEHYMNMAESGDEKWTKLDDRPKQWFNPSSVVDKGSSS